MLRRLLALLTFSALVGPAAAAAEATARFQPASSFDPVIGRYIVTLATTQRSEDAATADALARAYGGRLEPFAADGFRGFMIAMTPARARTLSADPRVASVREQAEERDPLLPSAPAPVVAPLAAVVPAASLAAPVTSSAVVARTLQPGAEWVRTGALWESGTIKYDGAGNVTHIGADEYRYDGVGRLARTTMRVAGVEHVQQHAYDIYGNMTRTETRANGGVAFVQDIRVDTATNRLGALGSGCGSNSGCETVTGYYDEAGNQLGVAGTQEFQWDALGLMIGRGAEERYLYDANDERIATLTFTGSVPSRRYTLRGSDNKVARELHYDGAGKWTVTKDYVYRSGTLIASFSSAEATTPDRHYHVDHLGSTRLVTDGMGYEVAFYHYLPFGKEVPGTAPDATQPQRLKFTGHERDGDANSALTIDYMHARYYNAGSGRFLSVDPILGTPDAPQSWNRYAYALNNPLRFTDPTGLYPCGTTTVSRADAEAYGLTEGDEMVVECADADAPTNTEQAVDTVFDVVTETVDTTARDLVGLIGFGNVLTGLYNNNPREIAAGYGQQLMWVGPAAISAGTRGLAPLADPAAGAIRSIGTANLTEKLALDEAMAGAGTRIMAETIKDVRYPASTFAKMRHVHRLPSGETITIHYWQNLVTGARFGFKFK